MKSKTTVRDVLFRWPTSTFLGFQRVDVTQEELADLFDDAAWAKLDVGVPWSMADQATKGVMGDRPDLSNFLGVLRAGKCYERVVFLKNPACRPSSAT
jgi:hypothetical protein